MIDRHAVEGTDERHLVAVDLTFADVNWVTLGAGDRTGQLGRPRRRRIEADRRVLSETSQYGVSGEVWLRRLALQLGSKVLVSINSRNTVVAAISSAVVILFREECFT